MSNIQKQNGADLIINISASPFRENKFKDRVNLVRTKVNEIKIPFLYCNLVGAQDDQVYDGGSFVMHNYGNLITQFPQFEPLTPILEFENKQPFIRYTNYNNLDIKNDLSRASK